MENPIIIIGNGIAGATAARELRKKTNDRIVMISEEYPYFISRPALMYVYMGHMKAQHLEPYERTFWSKNKIELVHDSVSLLDTDTKKITLAKGTALSYSKLIIATGSKPRLMDQINDQISGVVSLYHWQDLEKIEALTHAFGTKKSNYKIEKAVIVGGGLIGIELAEMLHTRGIEVTMVVRDQHYWGSIIDAKEGALIQRQLDQHHIQIVYGASIKSVQNDGLHVQSVELSNGAKLPCQLLGLTIGVEPRCELAKLAGIDCDRGILVDTYLQTSKTDVYAIGDCAQLREPNKGRLAIEAVWYCGKMMGETVALTIAEKPTSYDPGVWFNSAKFLHLEYQTYGQVKSQESENQAHFYWEDEKKQRALKLAFHPETKLFLGLNAWGIRIRQWPTEQAILQKWSIDQVIEALPSMYFDPEFTKSVQSLIAQAYHQFTTKSIIQ